MSAHTPGPWKPWIGADFACVGTGAYRADSDSIDGLVIDCASSGEDHSADVANARLIAAAPDMYAALKAAIAQSDEQEALGHRRLPMMQPLYDAAVAAIAKAEGK